MDPPHFYCPELTTGTVALPPTEAQHALHSLRLAPGEEAVLFDGRGTWTRAPLEGPPGGRRSRKRDANARFTVNTIHHAAPPSARLTLWVAACKGARLEWMVEKCTEFGATRIILAEFDRSVVRSGPQHVARLEKTAIAACKQCGRFWLPEIRAGVPLRELLDDDQTTSFAVAHPQPNAVPIGPYLDQCAQSLRQPRVVIGPEGGFSDEEIAAMRHRSATFVRLADHVLRIETAAVAVAANWAAVTLPDSPPHD